MGGVDNGLAEMGDCWGGVLVRSVGEGVSLWISNDLLALVGEVTLSYFPVKSQQ